MGVGYFGPEIQRGVQNLQDSGGIFGLDFQGGLDFEEGKALFLKGGGGGFRPIILETLIMRYGLKGKGRTRPDFFRVVFGPCEASEQKWGRTTKEIEL